MKSGGAAIGVGVLAIIGLVIFYTVKGVANLDAWDAAIVGMLVLVPLGMIVAGVLKILGIEIKF